MNKEYDPDSTQSFVIILREIGSPKILLLLITAMMIPRLSNTDEEELEQQTWYLCKLCGEKIINDGQRKDAATHVVLYYLCKLCGVGIVVAFLRLPSLALSRQEFWRLHTLELPRLDVHGLRAPQEPLGWQEPPTLQQKTTL
jgi:hypothetical protein